MSARRVIRVGVTGHRSFADAQAVADRLRVGLDNLRRLGGDEADGAPASLEILSALAVGADCLVARVALSQPETTLVAVLPLGRDDYVADFTGAESRREFEALLDGSRLVETMPPAASREAAYEQAGRWIVEHSDALVALWDGDRARGQGGTAEIVTYATECCVPILWVPVARTPRGRP